MNLPHGFDDDDDFFDSYDVEQVNAGMSLTPLDLDEAAHPTEEQLAHAARFRKPVALLVSAMALLSVVAIAVRAATPNGSQRTLVAHYSAALASPTPAAITTTSLEQQA